MDDYTHTKHCIIMPETPVTIQCPPFGSHVIDYALLLGILESGVGVLESESRPIDPEMPERGTDEYEEWFAEVDLHATVEAGKRLISFLTPSSENDIPF